MTMTFLGLSRSVEPQSLSSRRVVILVFVAAIFLSACLLFSVQPMFAKMVLPRLGGAASVWSIAMVFFQAMLLAGYLYAHLLTRYVPFRLAFAIHLCVLAVAFLAMPIAIAQGFGRPPASGEATWLIGLFAASVGLPFFAVAGNGPLLQAWFARTGHPDAQNPYFLYGASNIGSFAALLAYPLILEPGLTLREQSQLWMIGFVLLAVLIAGCAMLVFRAAPGETRAANHLVVSPAPTARQRAEWAALAFIPSALLVAVTAHIATDVASAPFMWVIPLALFLASFVLVFRSRELVSHRMLLGIQPLATGGLAIVLVFARWLPIEISLTLHLTIFMILATICHGALYRRRPDAGRLTEFYLWMSFGGALGGAFAGLAAPHLFNSVAEYPILLAMALIARPGLLEAGLTVWKREAAPIALLAAILLAPGLLIDGGLDPDRTTLFLCGLAILTILMQWQHARPVRLLALGALTLALSQVYEPGLSHAVYVRSFFGVHKVVDIADGRIRLLFNGTTIHGAERLRDDGGQPVSGRPEPLTYYHQKGPFQEAIQAARAQANGRLTHVALVGLGVGALACSRAPDETWTFYEIDPELVRLSAESGLFRTIPTCAAGQKIISGDARLTLPDSPEAFDLIVLDAYSSDNVPVHLLTREAMELWKSKLRPGGMIAMNITNRNISLAEIVSASADAAGLRMRRKQDSSSVDFEKTFHARAQIAVLAREPQDFGALDEATGWTDTIPDPAQRLWTDDYSDIVGAILRRWY
jgi:hypothetical protein